MKRMRLGVSCALALGLVLGPAAFARSSSPNDSETALHQVNSSEPQKPEICILDPVAMARASAPEVSVATDTSPVAEVPETAFDFGKIAGDAELVHKFSVRNAGKSVLNIKKVLPG